ncbi:MAG: hypothetical protein CL481_00450 [Acidobacteria bacterium]|nr:hypothetical protein [Acidobacteriota bacterium]
MGLASGLLDATGQLEDVPCNLCGADDYSVIRPARYSHADAGELSQRFRSSGDEVLIDQLVRCQRCGLQYVSPRLRLESILEGYSSAVDEDFVSQVGARERTFERCLDLVEAHAGPRGRILDVGTAGGSFLHVAQHRGWQVAGCEPSRWLCTWAQEHYGLRISPGTVFDMKEDENGSFDVVTLWDVLEHVPDPKGLLVECRRLLKPGGLLVVNYPDIGSWIARVMGRKWVFLLSVHLYYFTSATIQRLLHQAGFGLIHRGPHVQTLELGYIARRMNAYVPGISRIGSRLVSLLRVQHAMVPYWMGQTCVFARPIVNRPQKHKPVSRDPS